ncbi:MAG: ABC transporter substrate-binding protein [Mycobacterium sp.]|nr:ABC transporter substrate-binding protein [Mycobacterium sp.]
MVRPEIVRPRVRRVGVMLTALSLLSATLVACSSSGPGGNSGDTSSAATGAAGGSSAASGSGGAGNTASDTGVTPTSVKVGVLSVQTGPFGTEGGANLAAFKAVVAWKNANGGINGRKIDLDVLDDQSSPTTALANAKKLIQSDHVFAIAALDPNSVVAAQFLASAKIPVVTSTSGTYGEDFIPNIFGAYGNATGKNPTTTTIPLVLKQLGVTDVGSFAVSVAESSVAAAQATNNAAKAIGMKADYLNTSIPLGQPDFTPQALAVKKSGVDGLVSDMDQNSNASLMQALRNNSVAVKAVILAAGYNKASFAGASKAAFQGTYAAVSQLPGESNNPRVVQARQILKKYGNISDPPRLDESEGYDVGSLLLEGLTVAGQNPTQASFVTNLGNQTSWLGGLNIKPMNYKDPGPWENLNSGGQGLCSYTMKLEGDTFTQVSAQPVCGKVIGS